MSSSFGLSRSIRVSGVYQACQSWSLAVVACLLSAPAVAAPITYEMVTVGDAGNAADTGGTQNGSVAYEYEIGKYDVTIGQYMEFLNAVAKSDPYNLYNTNMGSNPATRGISRTGSSGSYDYSVIGPDGTAYGQSAANRPITYVSWFDAARFANWMSNGQGNGSTESGAYDLANAAPGEAPARTPGASFYIPDTNEWYKAAYYSPTLNSNAGGYYTYATQSNTTPGNTIGSTANQVNWYTIARGMSVTQSQAFDPNQNYLTDVGAFTNSGSYYGTFDQSGNVNQWTDLDGVPGSLRGLRGGYWFFDQFGDPSYLSSSYGGQQNPTAESNLFGFRLVGSVPSGVPEIDPNSFGSALAMVMGSIAMLEQRVRRAFSLRTAV